MGKPIEDIRGPQKSDQSSIQNSLQKSSSLFTAEGTTPSVFTNPSIKSFEDKDKIEIKEIDTEIRSNPFLMRYAHHGGGQENFGRIGGVRQQGGGKKILWSFAGILCVVALLSLSFAFAKATILVTPKTYTVAIDNTFTAGYQSQTGLSYETMSVENSESETVTSSGSTTGDVVATGKVRLYNEYSTAKQSLLINTRLEAPNGKIYMTDTATVIPGYTKVGTEIVPGSVEVGVHAEKGGADYNQDPTDFIIFGWKTDKIKSQKFYARSTTPLAGGSTGLVYTITPDEYNTKIAALEDAVRQKVRNQIYAEIPEGYFTFDDAILIEEKERTYALSSTDISIPITISLKATAFIFPKDVFVSTLRDTMAEGVAVSPETILQLESVEGANFTLSPESKNKAVTSISFQATGDVVLKASYDKDSLVAELLGVKTKKVSDILQNSEAILSIKVKMRPPWKQTFPKNPLDIEILEATSE
jgi:hypothetical protein